MGAREDVIALLMEHDTGLITEEALLAFLDQIECTAEQLEDAGAEMDRRAQDAHDGQDRLK